MLLDEQVTFRTLRSFPERTLCLTFDDGPDCSLTATNSGPRSLELARYLASEGAYSTFFMVGRNVERHSDIAAEIASLGHQLGLHTYDHPSLPQYHCLGGDVVQQLRLNLVQMPLSTNQPFYVRAPYGHWSPSVARALNSDLLVYAGCFGSIGWDNREAADWDHWRLGTAPAVVADLYHRDIESVGKGVILMHDSTVDIASVRVRNKVVELVQSLMPRLLQAGFSFCRLDSIPDLRALAAEPQMILRGANNRYLSAADHVEVACAVSDKREPSALLRPILIRPSSIAFVMSDNRLLSAQSGQILAVTADSPGEEERFEIFSLPDGKLLLRAAEGGFVQCGKDGILTGRGRLGEKGTVFSMHYSNRRGVK